MAERNGGPGLNKGIGIAEHQCLNLLRGRKHHQGIEYNCVISHTSKSPMWLSDNKAEASPIDIKIQAAFRTDFLLFCISYLSYIQQKGKSCDPNKIYLRRSTLGALPWAFYLDRQRTNSL